jgi:hypothetical protein
VARGERSHEPRHRTGASSVLWAAVQEFVDASFAERLYVARSDGVHGRQVALVEGWTYDAIRDFRLAQRVLRRVVRRLIESQGGQGRGALRSGGRPSG